MHYSALQRQIYEQALKISVGEVGHAFHASLESLHTWVQQLLLLIKLVNKALNGLRNTSA